MSTRSVEETEHFDENNGESRWGVGQVEALLSLHLKAENEALSL